MLELFDRSAAAGAELLSVESVGGKQAASVLSGGAGWEDGSTPEEGSAADKSSDGESSG